MRARRSTISPGARARPARQGRTPIDRPEPKPPRAARPDVAVGHRDRALAARSLHHLRQARAAAARRSTPSTLPPGAADRGTLIHDAVGDFTRHIRATRCRTIRSRALIEIGARHFAALRGLSRRRARSGGRASCASRTGSRGFETRRGAPGVAQAARRRSAAASTIPARRTRVHAAARADRIEQLADGRYAILDYKTGTPPTEKQVRIGTGAAADARSRDPARRRVRRTFAGRVDRRTRLCRAARRRAAGRIKPIEFKDGTPDARPIDALQQADRTGRRSSRTRRSPTCSLVHPMWKHRYGTYDHLARVKEWSLTGGDDEEGRRANERAAHHPGRACSERQIQRVRSGDLGLGRRPMPAPARPMCWRSASSGCCSTASTRRGSCASPSPRRRPPTWRTACSTTLAHGPRSTTPRSTRQSAAARSARRRAGAGAGAASCSPPRSRPRAA